MILKNLERKMTMRLTDKSALVTIRKFRSLYLVVFVILLLFQHKSGYAQFQDSLVEEPVDKTEYLRILEYYRYDAGMPLDPVFYGEWPWRSPHTLYKLSYLSIREQRVSSYLAIPKNKKSEKVPVIVLMHGWNLFWGKNEDWVLELIPFFTEQGYAVLAPDHFLFGERKVEGGTGLDEDKGPYYYRDWMTQSVVDLRRGIDYLLSRDDIDPDRIGIMGGSMGGWIGSILMAVDPRIKTSILTVPATEMMTGQTPPARVINTTNFVPHYTDISLLMILAEQDREDRNTRAKHLFEKVPVKKKLFVYDGPHYLKPEIYIDDILAWLSEQL